MLMIARMHPTPVHGSRWILAVLVLVWSGGCHGFARNHEAKSIPQFGVIDPNQARELHKLPLPPYVIEPPDELEITVKPPLADVVPQTGPPTYTVRADGFVDLGFAGDVFVTGSTLAEAEERIAAHLAGWSKPEAGGTKEAYQVSVRLAANQSKFYYVIGAVGNPGRFKSTGNETVLDAILQAGLRSHSLPEKAYLARPHPAGGPDQVLKIDWFGIKDRGDTLTNYQVLPGDRIVVPGTRPPGLLGSLLGQ
jgi:polysaccharide export outer membrane protein